MPLRAVSHNADNLKRLEERYSAHLPRSLNLVSALRMRRLLGLTALTFYKNEEGSVLVSVQGARGPFSCTIEAYCHEENENRSNVRKRPQ